MTWKQIRSQGSPNSHGWDISSRGPLSYSNCVSDKQKEKRTGIPSILWYVFSVTQPIQIIFSYFTTFWFQPWTEEDQDHADKRLALWIASSTLPVSMVKNPNMAGYVQAIHPKVFQSFTIIITWEISFQCKVPYESKTRKLVANLGDEMRAKLKRSLKPARRLNATTDIWSSKQYKDSYLGEKLAKFIILLAKWMFQESQFRLHVLKTRSWRAWKLVSLAFLLLKCCLLNLHSFFSVYPLQFIAHGGANRCKNVGGS